MTFLVYAVLIVGGLIVLGHRAVPALGLEDTCGMHGGPDGSGSGRMLDPATGPLGFVTGYDCEFSSPDGSYATGNRSGVVDDAHDPDPAIVDEYDCQIGSLLADLRAGHPPDRIATSRSATTSASIPPTPEAGRSLNDLLLGGSSAAPSPNGDSRLVDRP